MHGHRVGANVCARCRVGVLGIEGYHIDELHEPFYTIYQAS
jgi:hypothetical protein